MEIEDDSLTRLRIYPDGDCWVCYKRVMQPKRVIDPTLLLPCESCFLHKHCARIKKKKERLQLLIMNAQKELLNIEFDVFLKRYG